MSQTKFKEKITLQGKTVQFWEDQGEQIDPMNKEVSEKIENPEQDDERVAQEIIEKIKNLFGS